MPAESVLAGFDVPSAGSRMSYLRRLMKVVEKVQEGLLINTGAFTKHWGVSSDETSCLVLWSPLWQDDWTWQRLEMLRLRRSGVFLQEGSNDVIHWSGWNVPQLIV